MPEKTREVRPHSHPRKVVSLEGDVLLVPETWSLLPPGDATLTRRVKAAGPNWTIKERKGRRVFSGGVWADSQTIESIRLKLRLERKDPSYKRRLESGRQRRAKQEIQYAKEFQEQIISFLSFHPNYIDYAAEMARRVTEHAIPVGSGTVARTQRISVEKRAEAATIAWMRHQTTAYDTMRIAPRKGERRETRRRLAAKSKELLDAYRSGEKIDFERCPLYQALYR